MSGGLGHGEGQPPWRWWRGFFRGSSSAESIRDADFGRPELLTVLAVMALTMLLAWVTPVDTSAARWFYAGPGVSEPWPWGGHPIARFFYYCAPILAGGLGIGSLLGMAWARWGRWESSPGASGLEAGAPGRESALSGKHRRQRLRLAATYGFLVLLLGPGLVVNALLKDYSGRPRPRQTTEFSGPYAFRRPLELGQVAAGKSFPAGHASVGFAYVCGYFWWRRRRPRLAVGVLCGALFLGTAMGVCRMAAGAHFLSDVVMAGALTFLVAHLLYFHLLKVPQREVLATLALGDAPDVAPRLQRRPWEVAGLAMGGAVVGGVLLLAYPYHARFESGWPAIAEPGPLSVAGVAGEGSAAATVGLSVQVDRGQVTLDFTEPQRHLEVLGEIHGFGLPKKTVERQFSNEMVSDGAGGSRRWYRYQHRTRGVFTELEGGVTFWLAADRLAALRVEAPDSHLFVRLPDGFAVPPEWALEAATVTVSFHPGAPAGALRSALEGTSETAQRPAAAKEPGPTSN